MEDRFLCEVLDEMKATYETRNFSYLSGLIEEARSMAARMEAKLEDVRDIKGLSVMLVDLNEEKKDLLKEIKALEKSRDKMESPEPEEIREIPPCGRRIFNFDYDMNDPGRRKEREDITQKEMDALVSSAETFLANSAVRSKAEREAFLKIEAALALIEAAK